MPDYTQGNAQTRYLYDARVSGRKSTVATPGVPHKGNGQIYLTVKDTAVPWPQMKAHRQIFWREKRRRSSQPSPHSLLYPQKESIHGERDSRVGEDKETIKGRTSSETRV